MDQDLPLAFAFPSMDTFLRIQTSARASKHVLHATIFRFLASPSLRVASFRRRSSFSLGSLLPEKGRGKESWRGRWDGKDGKTRAPTFRIDGSLREFGIHVLSLRPTTSIELRVPLERHVDVLRVGERRTERKGNAGGFLADAIGGVEARGQGKKEDGASEVVQDRRWEWHVEWG